MAKMALEENHEFNLFLFIKRETKLSKQQHAEF